jgi:acyl dehydratase
MPLNSNCVGHVTEPVIHRYDWKDVVLYALGIGATLQELDFLYEARGPLVYPSYAVIGAFEAARAAFEVVGGNPLGIVHHGQKISVGAPLKSSGVLSSRAKVAGIYDLKRMAMVIIATETRDDSEQLVCESEFSIIFRLDGNFGGQAPPRRPKHKPPDRDADYCVEQTSSREQAALYRLCGDDNPLHIDPDIALSVGFDRPILHGLCTFGFVCRAVMQATAGNDPSRLKVLAGEFRKPVWPGDTLVTQIWKEPEQLILRATTREHPGDIAFGSAYAVVASQ